MSMPSRLPEPPMSHLSQHSHGQVVRRWDGRSFDWPFRVVDLEYDQRQLMHDAGGIPGRVNPNRVYPRCRDVWGCAL